MRKPIIGVMGGSKASADVYELARELGERIAQQGWILLNGGRNAGVMAASAEGAHLAGGAVIGILPDKTARRSSPHLDIAICTGIGEARNVINVLSSDVVIACPGKLGTRSEVDFALHYKKTVIALQFDLGESYDVYKRRLQLLDAESPREAVELTAAVIAELEDLDSK